ncbi:MAG: type III pantothenate kinase [Bacteroidota bacterium]
MNLIIDIGNTRTKAALFREQGLLIKEYWETPTIAALEKLIYNQTVENVILSSTANVPIAFEKWLKEKFSYIRLETNTPLPITIEYKTPETLGKDRIAAAVGADCLFPNEHALIIDAGTCITLDVITAEGAYLGGNISPGVTMRLQAMHHFTEKLPLLERSRESGGSSQGTRKTGIDLLGDSTESAMLNGAELGALLEITSFMEKCRRRFRPLRVIFTGGDADFFVNKIKTKIFANPNLVLIGLNKILQYNVRQLRQGKSKK